MDVGAELVAHRRPRQRGSDLAGRVGVVERARGVAVIVLDDDGRILLDHQHTAPS